VPRRGTERAAAPLTSQGYTEPPMLKWAIVFLVISLIAGGLGFSGIASGAAFISKILFAIFFVLFLLVLLAAWGIGELVF
jgi:uncharacterized membrane protein YtjA (UPF0391 family)